MKKIVCLFAVWFEIVFLLIACYATPIVYANSEMCSNHTEPTTVQSQENCERMEVYYDMDSDGNLSFSFLVPNPRAQPKEKEYVSTSVYPSNSVQELPSTVPETTKVEEPTTSSEGSSGIKELSTICDAVIAVCPVVYVLVSGFILLVTRKNNRLKAKHFKKKEISSSRTRIKKDLVDWAKDKLLKK